MLATLGFFCVFLLGLSQTLALTLKSSPGAPTRTCFSQPSDFRGPLAGQWTTDPQRRSLSQLYSGAANKASEFEHDACPLQEHFTSCFYHGHANAMDLKLRRFEPSQCLLKQFDAEVFLQAMAGKRILFIGDSMTGQHFSSFGCQMSKYIEHQDLMWTKTGESCKPWRQGKFCHLQGACVDFRHNVSVCYNKDYFAENFPEKHTFLETQGENLTKPRLMAEVEEDDSYAHSSSSAMTTQAVRLSSFFRGNASRGYDVVVVNYGAHYKHSSREKYYELVEVVADSVLAWQKRTGGRAIWRESSPEHFDTGSGDYAGQDGQAHEDGSYPCAPRKTTPGGWREALINPIFQKRGIDILHVYDLSLSQWDAHLGSPDNKTADCLHWCLPSVPDTWSELLYNMLLAPSHS